VEATAAAAVEGGGYQEQGNIFSNQRYFFAAAHSNFITFTLF